MNTFLRRLFLSVAATLIVGTCARAENGPVTIFAASSLQGALETAVASVNVDARIAYGGSGALARQIAAGAPADVVILAHSRWMDWLTDTDVVPAGSVVSLLSNRLVLIGSDATPLDGVNAATLLNRLAGGRIAMGQRDAVPAGIYARAWLTSIDAWEPLAGQLAETPNVRAALALVARNEAPLGIVYATDAAAEPRVHELYEIPASSHPPILYLSAALTPAGKTVVAALQSPQARATFVDRGFIPLEQR